MSPSNTALPSSPRNREGNEDIYEKIYVAILEHRLVPGTKLAEERMAEIFKVSRARIREVLARLAYEHIVELIPNKGAFIAKPTVEQARDIFEARRIIEPAIMRRLASNMAAKQAAALREHIAQERQARKNDDKRAVIRLSGEFHNLCADLAGNVALSRSLRELTTLTCLIILVYDAPTAHSCREDEHSMIVEALIEGNEALASTLMSEHLDHIEGSVNLDVSLKEVDLADIFT
ncbi:GntR family transcriptional regulator [Castellaniella sp. MT123]|uniref:GntR family transcriptional regulator n=1 Tax=Castellaniella sp. MT123 TaxID=3140381 RepID=UPI0031F38736